MKPRLESFTESDYQAPAWMRSRHLQTIWPAVIGPGPRISYRRERVTTPDEDFIDLDWTTSTPAGEPGSGPLLVLFHGLEGNSESHYARSLMTHVAAAGWRGVVVHWRGCSGEPNLLARAYHSGDSAEVDWIVRRLRPDFVAGVSLGANALLKWAGEQGSKAGIVKAVAGVSAPQDLHAGALALSKGFNRLYCLHFLKTLKRKSILKLAQFPDIYDRRAVTAARDFSDFDGLVTAPLHGFDSAIDYWTRSSCRQFLGDISVPTLVLNARNDPFLPESSLAGPSEVSRHVLLEYPAEGGHVGFIDRRLGADWLPRRLMGFFRRFA
jgi:predicted alpha/beta-fold hydrolase